MRRRRNYLREAADPTIRRPLLQRHLLRRRLLRWHLLRRHLLRRHLLQVVTGTILVGLLVTACSGAGSGGATSSSGGSSAVGAGARAPEAAAPSGSDAAVPEGDSSRPGNDTESQVVLGDREIVSTAALTVRVKDVDRAVTAAEDVATGSGGLVFGEESSTDPDAPDGQQSTLTLKVPPDAFRPTLARLAELGTKVTQTQSAQDVTSRVVDVRSRVQSQRMSVDRLRALLAKAKTVAEVISVESELTRREADLESLEAQQKALEAQTALATITLTVVGPGAVVVDSTGFRAGVQRGWHAFVATTVGIVTVLGAVLPFGLALALVLVPVALLIRRRRSAARPGESPAAAS